MGWGTALRRFLICIFVVLACGSLTGSVSAESYNWKEIGPYGGTIRELVVDQLTPATLYAVTNGGVYKSTNGGASWAAMNSGLTDLEVLALVIDSISPATLYVATQSGGVFKSTNGGGNWNAMNSGLLKYTENQAHLEDIEIDPNDPNILYVISYEHGPFKTTDGGGTWFEINNGLTGSIVRNLLVDPNDPSHLFVTADHNYESFDGGDHWSYPEGLGPNMLAIDPIHPDTLYGFIPGGHLLKSVEGGANWTELNNSPIINYSPLLVINPFQPSDLYLYDNPGLSKSTDGGETWSVVNTGLSSNSWVYSLALDPATSSTLYIGTSDKGILKSTDDAESWNGTNAGLTNISIVSIEVNPAMPSTLYTGTIGKGIFKSTNGGANWTTANTGLTSPYVHILKIDPNIPTIVYAGLSNGAFRSTNSGDTWSAINSGLTNTSVNDLAIDPTTPPTLYAATDNGVFKTTNAGQNWISSSSGLTEPYVLSLVIDPQSNTTIYAVTWAVSTYQAIFKSLNGGGNWSLIYTTFTTHMPEVLLIDPQNSEHLYVGTRGGGVYKSTNSGGNWSAVNTGLTNLNIYALVIDPVTPDTLYAGTSGGGVFKSTNGGASWDAYNQGLSNLNVHVLTMLPDQSDVLYTGTWGGGVFSLETSNPIPVLSSLDPQRKTTLDSGFSLALYGTGFIEESLVMWGTTSLETTLISAFQLNAEVPASALSTPGTVAITVENPGPGGGTSNVMNFKIARPAPELTDLSPSSKIVGSSGFPLTVNGKYFRDGAVLYWGQTPLNTSFINDNQLIAMIPTSTLAVTGSFAITAENPDLDSEPSNALNFTVANPIPSLTTLAPFILPVGSPDLNLMLYGTNFVDGTTAFWDASPLTTIFNSDTDITVVIPNSFLLVAGTFTITAANPGPGGGISNGLSFTVANPWPVLTGLSDITKIIGSPGFTLTVNGTNFIEGASIYWGENALTTTRINSTQLRAVVPAAALAQAGTFLITVVNPGPGGGTSAQLVFTVAHLKPHLSYLNPAWVLGGSKDFDLLVVGDNFASGAVVYWNGSELETSWITTAQLSAIVPAWMVRNTGKGSVMVKNPEPNVGESNSLIAPVLSGLFIPLVIR